MTFHRARALTGVLSVAMLAAGCALPMALPDANTLSPPPGKIVIVGKVVLDPPLSPDLEQRTYRGVIGDESIRNQVLIATADHATPIAAGDFRMTDWQSYIDARWGEYFVAVVPRETRYLNGLATPLDVKHQDFLWFPGGLVLRPPAEGDVVYVGTVRLVRNDFNEIVGVDVHNEKPEALADLQERFDHDPVDLTDALWLRQLPWEDNAD